MLAGILIIITVGFIAGEAADRLGFPRLIGMLLAGILIGPYVLDILPPEILHISDEIRLLTLLIILLKAGIGLDKDKILNQGTVAIRLGFLPAIIEATVVALATRWILGWEWLLCWLLGWIICAASPAVIVPLMLRLKTEGWGVKKGIPDLILAGGTASDATAVTMFGIFLAWITEDGTGNIIRQLSNIPLQIILGILFGFIAGKTAHYLLSNTSLTENIVHDLIISLGLGLLLVLGDDLLPYSPFLAVMVMGFVILETDPVLARQLRKEVDKIWVVGEVFLFVLIGAAVNIYIIAEAGLAGLAIIGIGLAIGRWAGIFASTWRSIISIRERLFMVVGDMAKATVQAAIGGIPLTMGMQHGEYILAISVLAILITAPLGAFGTVLLAPKILEKGKIDPTKINVKEEYSFLVAIDDSESSIKALEEATRISRQLDASLIALNVHDNDGKKINLESIKEKLSMTIDINHVLILKKGNPAEIIIQEAEERDVDYIFMGRNTQESYMKQIPGDISQRVLENSSVPVILVARDPLKSQGYTKTHA